MSHVNSQLGYTFITNNNAKLGLSFSLNSIDNLNSLKSAKQVRTIADTIGMRTISFETTSVVGFKDSLQTNINEYVEMIDYQLPSKKDMLKIVPHIPYIYRDFQSTVVNQIILGSGIYYSGDNEDKK